MLIIQVEWVRRAFESDIEVKATKMVNANMDDWDELIDNILFAY